jgi:AraC-like DNA-binding protein
MVFDILDIIGILTAFQLLLLAFFLINHQKGKKLSHKILALFLFANALYILDYLQFHLRLYHRFPHLIGIGFLFIFMFGPLLFFYTRSLVVRKFSFKRSDLLHLLPFALLWISMILHFYVHDAATKLELIAAHKVFSVGKLNLFDVAHTIILGYMITTLSILRKFRRELKLHFFSIEHPNLSWLRLVLYGFLFMWLCDLANSLLPRFFTGSVFISYSLTLLSLLINFVFASIAVYRSLKQPEIFSGLTVLEVLYEVGFNSKSAFNMAFKRYTGAPPASLKNII